MAYPMSGMSKGARYSQSRTDTLIGAGLRVNGNVEFTGVLRIQGDILGKVACDLDSSGTVVVSKSGNITGTVKAPHIVVGGHVHGPVSSSESIEIQHDACLIGDANYKTLEVHAGGVIEGALTPLLAMDAERRERKQPGQIPESKTVEEPGLAFGNAPPAGGRDAARFGSRLKLGLVITLLIAAIALLVVVYRDPAAIPQPVADVVLKADSSMQATVQPPATPVDSGVSKDGGGNVARDALPLAPSAVADTGSLVRASTGAPEKDSETPEIIQGVNPGKPAGVFSVISKEPTVLFKKKRLDPDGGTRIDVAQGATENIAIAKNEIFRVAQGRNIIIYYQGRKVPLKTIESGSWMSFVPHSPGGASDKR